ncbi:MAG: B-box zinc finger protein [Armatimonadetes bacterium]|nr:B-box zinc finger protein [Armatimonadota bacterium]
MLETQTYCPRHPRVETALRCAACNTLICPQCLVQTPVGAKCRECGSQRGIALFSPSIPQAAAAAGAAVFFGVVAGWAVEFSIGLFTCFLAVIYGGFVGEMIIRASGRKRGRKMEVIAIVATLVGVIGGRLVVAAMQIAAPGTAHPPFGILNVITDLVQPSPIPAIAIVIVIASAVSRIRYL